MMQSGATLFLGAPTRLGIALNDLLRLNGADLAKGGIRGVRNLEATHAMRAAIGEDADPAALLRCFDGAGAQAVFVSAMYGLGRPGTAFKEQRLYPEAERIVAGTAEVAAPHVTRLVLAIEPLHQLFMSVAREVLAERVRAARWDRVFEASWTGTVDLIRHHFPGAPLVVLTPAATSAGPAPMLHHLFGEIGFELAGERAGEALVERANVSFGAPEIEAALGLDAVTCDLLEQRFREDIAAIARFPGIRVF